MPSLTHQLMDLFAPGAIYERADLKGLASYDAISRALGQLVRRGQLVRLQRGQFCRVADRPHNMTDPSTVERIDEQVRRSSDTIFVRRDFAALGSYHAVGQALRHMLSSGAFIRIGHGLYAKSERLSLAEGHLPASEVTQLAHDALVKLGREIVPIAATTVDACGVSPQPSEEYKWRIKGRLSRRIGYGKYTVPIKAEQNRSMAGRGSLGRRREK